MNDPDGTGSRPASHFAAMYQANPDPWEFGSSAYEQAKYRHTIDALGVRRFASALEVGCSIGILTRMLAERCDNLLGIDIVEDPLPAARQRCADQPWVRFERMRAPEQWPADRFDLIVLSEVLYFLSADDIRHCADRVVGSLAQGGLVVLVNWLGKTEDPSSGDAAPDRFIAAVDGRLRRIAHERRDHYRLDLLVSA